MFLICIRLVVNGPINCIHVLFKLLSVPVPSLRGFGSFLFPINPYETKRSYFETQTQKIENSKKPVTNFSLVTAYDLV